MKQWVGKRWESRIAEERDVKGGHSRGDALNPHVGGPPDGNAALSSHVTVWVWRPPGPGETPSVGSPSVRSLVQDSCSTIGP